MSATDPSLPASVLFTAANYWPEESGSSPYTTESAEDLASRGVAVTALTAMPHYPGWRIRDGYRGRLRLREERNGVRLVRSWLWVPHSQSAVQRAVFEGSFFLSTLTARRIREPDAVVGFTPSLSGALLARAFGRRFGVPYGVVVQDLVGPGALQSGIKGGPAVASAVRRMERAALTGASAVAVVSDGFVPYLEELGIRKDRIELVPNWSHIARSGTDPARVREGLGLPADTTIVLHAGAMGMKQGLGQIIDAAREGEGRPFLFVLMGGGSQRRELERSARGLSNVRFLPPQPSREYADLLAAADILLVSERRGMVDMSLPGKLTSYLAAGRPVVAAVAPAGATAREVERSGAGVVTPAGATAALLRTLEDLRVSPDLRAEMGERGATYAADNLSRGRGLAGFRRFVAGLVGRRTDA